MDANPLQLWFQSQSIAGSLVTLIWTHFIALIGFLLALLIVGRMFNEKRNPSNVFAWSLAILFVPYISIPLYFLFGGYKNQRLLKHKKKVLALAAEAARIDDPQDLLQRKWPGNSIQLLKDGSIAYKTICKEIERAEKSIAIMTYIIGRDRTGKSIIDLLAKRASEGLDVKFMIDAFGSFGRGGKWVQPIRDAGGRVVRFMPVLPLQTKTSANLRNHRKIAIFDSQRAIVGGQNLDKRFLGPRNHSKQFHDFSALIEGPMVSALQRIFISDWCFATGDAPETFKELLAQEPKIAGEHPIEVVASGPDGPGDPLWEKIIRLIQDSRKRIDIVTPYFIPDEVLFQSLLIKARAGHLIRLIVPRRSNQWLVDFARYYYLRKLHEAGVEVLLYAPKMIHAKLFLVDGEIGMFGSANMDNRSLFVNFEIGLFVNTEKPLKDLNGWMEALLPDCIRYEDSKQAGAGKNRQFIEDFAHLLVPLL